MRFDKDNLNYYNLGQYSLAGLCLLAVSGAIVYRIYALDWLGVAISVSLAALIGLIIAYLVKKFNLSTGMIDSQAEPIGSTDRLSSALAGAYLLFALAGFYILFKSATSTSIISPWQAVPVGFFGIYLLATMTLIILTARRFKASLLLISLHYFLSFGVIWLVYRVGYGYDFFVHQATLQLIDKQGLVLPKPDYYLGQYSLIIIFHKLLGLSINWLSRLLVPVLAAIFLPLAFYPWVKASKNYLAVLSLLILPFSFLTFTTPQNLAYLFLLLLIINSINNRTRFNYVINPLLVLAALSVQPIAGLPALGFLIVNLVYQAKNFKFKSSLIYLTLGLNTLSIPLAFYLLDQTNFKNLSFGSLFSWPSWNLAGQESLIMNFVYFYGFNFGLIYFCLAAAGFIIYHKQRSIRPQLKPFIIFAPSIFLAYFLSKSLTFNFLINYEQADYSDRVWLVGCMFLLPFAWLAISELAKRILSRDSVVRLSWLGIYGLVITASLYLAYPRFDPYFNSRGFSTGSADLAAVNWINQQANTDYIVLADQQVSAAALDQFGFDKYYNNYFYYPVPTSGPLYQFYLKMVYEEPSRATMQAAMDLTGVKTGYFVLNKYWWAFAKILAEAKLSADSSQTFNNGEVYVFKYSRQ